MDGVDYAAQIDALKRDVAGVRQQMEGAHKAWLMSVSDALVAWYETTVRDTVREQYRHAAALGQAGVLRLKERFVAFLQDTPALVTAGLSEPQCWTHKLEPDQITGKIAREDAYDLGQPWLTAVLRDGMAALFGRLGTFLSEAGFAVPEAVSEASDPRTALGQTKVLCSRPNPASALARYAGQHVKLIGIVRRMASLQAEWGEALARERQLQEQRRIEQERGGALALWDNAFSRSFGETIDWEKAWDKADRYWDDKDEWGPLYEEWLIEARPKEGSDDFEAFLTATGDMEKYERQVKRVWRVGLLKAVLRQLGKSQPEPWIFQLLDEQIAQRSAADEHDSYQSLLDNYREHACSECSAYCEDGTCYDCDRCDDCCVCGAEGFEDQDDDVDESEFDE